MKILFHAIQVTGEEITQDVVGYWLHHTVAKTLSKRHRALKYSHTNTYGPYLSIADAQQAAYSMETPADLPTLAKWTKVFPETFSRGWIPWTLEIPGYKNPTVTIMTRTLVRYHIPKLTPARR